jgi:2-octaprenyl-6-methoxyphenol hydroxylase
MTTDFDIAICGAGPVGLALALLLVKRGAQA